jgi:hypothetical protein
MQIAKDSMMGRLTTRCTIYRQFVSDDLITNTYEKRCEYDNPSN